MIDLIIPAYNAKDTINKTLISIAMQTISDKVNVYIINDKSNYSYSSQIKLFEKYIKIKELKLKNNYGPGFARQYGIDHSKSDYISFIDADDVFHDVFSLEKLYTLISKENADFVYGGVLEENENSFIESYDNQRTFAGKIYKRSFLKKNNIKFNNTRHCEDLAFNQLILGLFPKIIQCNEIVYIYCFNNKSVTRENNDYSFYSLEWYSYNVCWIINEIEKRNGDKNRIMLLIYYSLRTMYENYNYYTDVKQKKQILLWSVNLYNYFIVYKESVNYYRLYTIISKAVNKNLNISFDDFLGKIDNIDVIN